MTDDELEDVLAALISQHDATEARIRAIETQAMIQNHRMKEMAEELVQVKSVLDQKMKQSAIGGTFPPLDEIEKLQVQIFHNDLSVMSAKQKCGGTKEWVVKFEYWHRGQRQPDAISIPMLTPAKFLHTLTTHHAEDGIIAAAENMDDSFLGGVVRRSVIGGGRAYLASQVIVMSGHGDSNGEIAIILYVDGNTRVIDQFRPGAGGNAKSAKWFGLWQPNPTSKTS